MIDPFIRRNTTATTTTQVVPALINQLGGGETAQNKAADDCEGQQPTSSYGYFSSAKRGSVERSSLDKDTTSQVGKIQPSSSAAVPQQNAQYQG